MADLSSIALGAAAAPPPGPALLSPALLFVLCMVGAIGMILLLPGRKESSIRHIGAAILMAVAVILAVVVGRHAAGISVYFWIFSAIALFGAVRVITHTKPVYSALYFVLTVMASAGLFVLMWAAFMAAALILIYAGAILVTYVFVIMLAAEAAPARTVAEESAVEHSADHDLRSREPVVASAVGFALMGVLLFVIFDRAQISPAAVVPAAAPPAQQTHQAEGATQQIGEYLFSTELVSLELAGLILTVAMVGAIVIARRRVYRAPAPAAEARPDVFIAPATPIDDNPHSIPVYGTDNPRQKAYPET